MVREILVDGLWNVDGYFEGLASDTPSNEILMMGQKLATYLLH